MKIYYGYGKPIEVSDEWHDILIAEDHNLDNHERTETRRHCSLGEDNTPMHGSLENEMTLRDFRERALSEPAEITKEELRGIIAAKAESGFRTEVKALLKKHGSGNLTSVPPENYATLKADAEALQ